MSRNDPSKGDISLRSGNDWTIDKSIDAQPIQDNDLVAINVARGWLPRASNGRKISLDTLYRWCHKGLKSGVRLEAVKIGSRWFTTRKWVQDFIRAGQPNLTIAGTAPKLRTQPQRHRAANWAEGELRAAWKKPPRNPHW